MSVGTCTSVIGCAGGAVLATIGADQFLTGYEQLFSGQPQKTAGAALLETFGVPADIQR